MRFDPKHYGPVLGRLVDTDRMRALDAGIAVTSMAGELRSLRVETAFAHAHVASRDMASCCISAVWLLYDFLDESHAISQGVKSASGSFWHGIMHRREGDYANAKYWFGRVGAHPIFADLARAARELAAADSSKAAPQAPGRDEWDPYRFVDRCEAAVGGKSADAPLIALIQQAEWELLFDFCYAEAVA
jgi:hypothetical protein